MKIDSALKKSIFLPYQKEWIKDKSEVKVWEKSRRIGASYVEAFVSVIYASLCRADGGMSCYYLSYSKEMTQQFVSDCGKWARLLGIACSDLQETVLRDGERDIMVYRIRFDSGYEIWGLPSVARSLRSKQGHVIIDEAAFVDDLDELLKAAMALLMWGGSVSILSTHDGDDNPFNTLIKQIHAGEKPYSLHRTTITDALHDGLYKRICDVKKQEWTAEGETEWLSQLEKEYGDASEEELHCIPTSSGARYFSSALIRSVASQGVPVFRFQAEDSFTFESEDKRIKKCLEWFDSIKPVLEAVENPVVFGEDFARSGDLTVLHFDEELSDGGTNCICEIEMRNVPFAQQWQMIRLCANALPNFNGAAFDSRGNGQMVAELAEQEWAGCIFPVMLTRKWYAENFPKLRDAFEDGKSNIPSDHDIMDDYKVVSIIQGVPLITERTGSKRAKRHGDSCIAKVMAHFAHCELEGAGYQTMTYEAVTIKNKYRAKYEEDDKWNDYWRE